MPILLIASCTAVAFAFRLRIDTQVGTGTAYATFTDKNGDVDNLTPGVTPVAFTTSVFSFDVSFPGDDVRSVSFNSSTPWAILTLHAETSAGEFVQWMAITSTNVLASATASSGELALFFNPARPPVIISTLTGSNRDAATLAPTIVTIHDVFGDSCVFTINSEMASGRAPPACSTSGARSG
ncbi:hypothetical protein DIPPA_03895 [Diplonema papillatum]|nr:hypothetical protein DIPPA_03895 [Diplonema papillatum]